MNVRFLSDWEVEERSARIKHMARLIARGADPRHVIEEMPDATAAEVENARARARRGAGMEDDVRQSSADRYAVSQAYRWRAERDQARQELGRGAQDAENRRVELCATLDVNPDTGWSDAMECMRRRLMPEGMEWPRYEDGEQVRLNDVALLANGLQEEVYQVHFHGSGFALYTETSDVDYIYGERVERPAVPAADGEPLEVGQTVWDTNGDELVIGALEDGGHTVTCRYADVGDGIPVHGMWSPSDLTHQRPVLDADGEEIRVGDVLYSVETGDYVTVGSIEPGNPWFATTDGALQHCAKFTHRAPVFAADGEPLEARCWVEELEERGTK